MTNSASDLEGGAGGRFEYFMIRLRRAGDAADELSGQIERVGSGEKRRFDTGEHLLELVAGWPGQAHGTHDRHDAPPPPAEEKS